MTGINMSSLLSANIAMKQAEVQGNVRNQMKDSANVLRSRIEQERSSGKSLEAMKEELEKTESRVQDLENSQMNTLSDINKQIEKDAKEVAESRIEGRRKADKERAEKLAEKHMDEKKEAENQTDVEPSKESSSESTSTSDQASVNVLVWFVAWNK